MAADKGDDLVPFQDVSVIHSTAPAITARGTAIRSSGPSLRRLPAALHLVRRAR
jgi:hypothetical protein